MAKLTLFYLEHCPYCRNARRAVDALRAEKPEYAAIEIDWIEESQSPDIAGQYDYYYVPTVFSGTEKLYEASPSEDYDAILGRLREVFERVRE